MGEVIEPLRLSFDVACSAAHAFVVWTDRIDAWWPRDHTATNDPRFVIRLEKRVGGRLFEVTPGGAEHLWGTATTWQPSDGSATTGTSAAMPPMQQTSRSRLSHTAGAPPFRSCTPAKSPSAPTALPGAI